MSIKTYECKECGEVKPHIRTDSPRCVVCQDKIDKEKLAKRTKRRVVKKKMRKARVKAGKRAKYVKKSLEKKNRSSRNYERRKRAQEDPEVKAERLKKAAEGRRQSLEKTQAQLAQQELARRELARRDLLGFIKYFHPEYQAGWLHEDICLRLEQFLRDVVEGRNPHLMLFVPPRHGKSMIVSENFPAWVLGQYPGFEFIATSYSGLLSNQFSRKVQEKLRDPAYHNIFPGVGLSPNNQSVENWGISHNGTDTRGGYLSAGVGGPTTGRGANIFLIDDPVKNREEAESQQLREAAKAWFTSTAYTRLMPLSGIIIIMTRWHDDDLAGWQLRQMQGAIKEQEQTGQWPDDANKWDVIKYPAIATEDEKYRKRGETLHEDRYPITRLAKIKRTVGPRDWAALYQQTPTAEEGEYFRKNQIRYYTGAAPMGRLDVYCAGDLAISKKETADYSVFLVVGMDEHEDIWVLDERRGRWDTNEIINEIFDIASVWKPKKFGIEKGHISMAVGPVLDKRIQEERRYDVIYEEMPTGKQDKQIRARPIQGRIAQGKVKWPSPEEALWVPEHINELLRFPNGVNDDRVDAVAWIGQMLIGEGYHGGPGGLHKKAKKSWRERLKKFTQAQKPKDHMAA